jgi:hypothetical protein
MRKNLIRIAFSLLLGGIGFLGAVIGRKLILYFFQFFETSHREELFVIILLTLGIVFVFIIYWLSKKHNPITISRFWDVRITFLLIGAFCFGIGVAVLTYSLSALAFMIFSH